MGASFSVWTDGQTDMLKIIVENHTLPGYYEASNGNSLLTFRDNLSIPFQGILEDGTDWLSRNLGKELSLLAEYWPRRAQFPFASRRLLAWVMNSFRLITAIRNFANAP